MYITASCHQRSREQEGTHSNRTPRMRATAMGTPLSSGFDHIRTHTSAEKSSWASSPSPCWVCSAQGSPSPAAPCIAGTTIQPQFPQGALQSPPPSSSHPSRAVLTCTPISAACSHLRRKHLPGLAALIVIMGRGSPVQIGLTYADGLHLFRWGRTCRQSTN